MSAVLPAARSSAEARLYVELHPCGCAETQFEPQVEVVALADGDLATRYQGSCAGCGTAREFLFRLPAEPVHPPAGATFSYGGPEPSRLIDPGEWLAVADRYAALVPADFATAAPAPVDAAAAGPGAAADSGAVDPDAADPLRRRAAAALSRAVAALDEVLKFIPADADEVPPDTVTSEVGQRMRRREPGRFRRDRLTALRDTYTALLPGNDASQG
ncbi:hypothetical protein O7621_03780 [Solwaraspora sp. WMMD937]|uniref:hypothetical protein n=1 Tax=Solwaraspora sp. WMMD937 TaxID=3016090 RepID=UPI00249C116B|nr:hypothetical protein [Solwaraspora sp. WMMD937]WFE22478.1 hypothetical protein O7621_03780 [Solwaraspora sp. WMMD937]